MATAQITLEYPTGYTPEADGSGTKLLPSGLSWDGTDYSGADGIYDVLNVSATGQWTYEAVVIGEEVEPPADGPASNTFTLNPPSGYSVVTIPQDYDSYIFQGWDTQPKVGGKLVYDNENGATELNSEPNLVKTDSDTLELYYVDPDTGEWTYAPITWANLPVAGDEGEADTTPDAFTIPALTDQPLNAWVEFAPVEVTGVDAGEDIPVSVSGTDVQYAVDAGSGYGAFTATSATVQLGYFVKPRLRTPSDHEAEAAGTLTIGGISAPLSATTEAEDVQPPQGTVTVGAITVDHESASIPFSYDENDHTGFEHSVNGSTWTAATSPIVRHNLNPQTVYGGEIRAVNADGPGQTASYSFTTYAEPATVPQGLITFGTASVAATSWSLPFSYSMDDADGFEYRINGGNWSDVTSPVSMYNADPETSYTVEIRPYNDQGAGNVLSAIVTTTPDTIDPQPDETVVERVYTIEAYKNRMPDIQRFAMYQGDRVRLLVDHSFDLAGKQLLFRLAPKKGAPARFTLTSENNQFVITSAMAEELAVSNKVWQLILKENESRVVVGEGAVDIRYRIKE